MGKELLTGARLTQIEMHHEKPISSVKTTHKIWNPQTFANLQGVPQFRVFLLGNWNDLGISYAV